MCLIVTKPEKVKFPRADVARAFNANDDSIGIAYANDGSIHIRKWVNPTSTEHIEMLDLLDTLTDVSVLVHYRLATHGLVNSANAHPMRYHGCAIAHNGIIAGYGDAKHSDTVAFLNAHIRAYRDVAKLDALGSHIGSSKLAALLPSGEFRYANKELGHESDGCWFSNRSYAYSYRYACDTYVDSPYSMPNTVPMWQSDSVSWEYQDTSVVSSHWDKLAYEVRQMVWRGVTSKLFHPQAYVELSPITSGAWRDVPYGLWRFPEIVAITVWSGETYEEIVGTGYIGVSHANYQRLAFDTHTSAIGSQMGT